MLSPALFSRIRNDLDFWETPVSWMYLDSVGLVTVGCGTMLPSADFAAAIAFYHANTQADATAEEIKAAWNALHSGSAVQKAAAPKHKNTYRHYENDSDLRITDATASTLRDAHVLKDYAQLAQIFPTFESLPDDAKLALFDMIYNLGAGRSATKKHRGSGLRAYATMIDAIAHADWGKAALTSRRRGIPEARNQQVAQWFRNCSPPPSTMTIPGVMMQWPLAPMLPLSHSTPQVWGPEFVVPRFLP